jgi:uncharacterized protein (DUF2236 family)
MMINIEQVQPGGSHPPPLRTHWPAPMNARHWDERFPGILDGILIMAGAANVIMQLSLLPVGHGVAESKVESGAIFKHPIKRARTTFTYLAVALMGTGEEKMAYRKAVNRSHAQVHSSPDAKVQYNAFDPELQLWVAACLYWGIVDTYRKLRPSTRQMEEAFYLLAEPLATTLQVSPGMWPPDLQAFDEYWARGLERLQLDDTVRRFLTRLVDLKFLPPAVSQLIRPLNRFLTTGFLLPRVRGEMRLPWNACRQQQFETFLRVIGQVNALFPRVLRQLPINLVMWDFRRRRRKNLPLV